MKKVSEILLKIVLYPAFIVVTYYAVLLLYMGNYHLVAWFTSWSFWIILLISTIFTILGIYYTLVFLMFLFGAMSVITKLKLNRIFVFVTILLFNCFLGFRGLKLTWEADAGTGMLLLLSIPIVCVFLAILIPSLMALGAEKD